MFNTLDELKETLDLQRSSVQRIGKELDAITARTTSILGPDGLPVQESMDRINAEVMGVMYKYLRSPSLHESEAVYGLGENSIQGASFSLMVILSVILFQPVSSMFPNFSPVVIPAYLHTLGQFNDGSTIEDVFGDLCKLINVKAKEEASGATILGAREELGVNDSISDMLGMFLIVSAKLGFLSVPETRDSKVKLDPNGVRVLSHLASISKWISEVQEAQIRLKAASSIIMS